MPNRIVFIDSHNTGGPEGFMNANARQPLVIKHWLLQHEDDYA